MGTRKYMKKKRRKFLTKQNLKRKAKLRKLNGGVKIAAQSKSGSIVDDLMFAELMRPYEETVATHFTGRPAVVYRSVSMPAKQEDLRPRKLRMYESVAQAEVEYKMPDVANLEDWERLKNLNKHLGSSVFTEEGGLRAMWQKGYKTKKTPSEKRKYKEDMGWAMVKLTIEGAQDGQLQNENEIRADGHLNFLPSSTFKLEEHIDQEYGYNGYMPFLEEDIKKLYNNEEREE